MFKCSYDTKSVRLTPRFMHETRNLHMGSNLLDVNAVYSRMSESQVSDSKVSDSKVSDSQASNSQASDSQ
uniref:Uncharacterized protein n=1 Tax=Romanomermis culicivorax TaxID=13658 RepID=A0A915K1P1_ROMCU